MMQLCIPICTHTVELNISNLHQILLLLDTAQPEWFQLGLQLKLPSHELEAIRKDFYSTKECYTEMLTLWLKKIDPMPSWAGLLLALKRAGCGNLALKLSEDHDISFPGIYGCSSMNL